jgi:hypothetical protein
MAKPNLKAQAKRKRELAKKQKRAAKDEKRALRKAERTAQPSDDTTTATPAAPNLSVPPGGVSQPLSLSALGRTRRS